MSSRHLPRRERALEAPRPLRCLCTVRPKVATLGAGAAWPSQASVRSIPEDTGSFASG